MSTIPSKQIIKILSAPVRVAGFSATGGDDTVTTAITTALSTAGDGGVSVPLQVSSSVTVMGVITAVPHNRVEIYDATTKDKIKDVNGNEVYGRLSEISGTYTLSYHILPDSGVDTTYAFAGATNIDFEFNYRFDFVRYPADGAIATQTRNVGQDPIGLGGLYTEQLTVTATNTVSSLSKVPTNSANVSLLINGVSYDSLGGGSADFSVNTTTKAVTWSAANGGFALDTTDRVIARYTTYE